jgi:hypothetical protein
MEYAQNPNLTCCLHFHAYLTLLRNAATASKAKASKAVSENVACSSNRTRIPKEAMAGVGRIVCAIFCTLHASRNASKDEIVKMLSV